MSKQVKSNYEIIKSIKKANKVAREKMAQNAGFASSEVYLQFLQGNSTIAAKAVAPKKIAAPKQTITGTFEKRPTIHIVDVLDASGSMDSMNKYKIATQGIQNGVYDLIGNSTANFTYSFTEFIDSSKIINHLFMSKDLPTSLAFAGPTGYNTPLYRTVYDLLTSLAASVKDEDKVLVKIYTDGIDNATPGFRISAAKLIHTLNAKNFTITFVATVYDMPRIVEVLNLDESNTLGVTNDGAGFQEAFRSSSIATMSFVEKVSKGEDVLTGFYKKSGTL